MSEAMEAEAEVTEAPAKKPVRRRKTKRTKVARKARAEKVEPDRPVYQDAGELAGISASKCPKACTERHCVISTVAICKHPFLTADNGCGPVTMANRIRARKLIRHQMIDMKE